MTRIPNNESHNHQSPAGQRLDERHRQQLSALVDGELGADEARFLVRRTTGSLGVTMKIFGKEIIARS